MPDVPRELLVRSVLGVLTEAVIGPEDFHRTWFESNEPGVGLLGHLSRLSAAQASRTPGPHRRTVVAHAAHTLFGLRAARAFLANDKTPQDWDRSWIPATVSDSQWDALLSDTRIAHTDLVRAIESTDEWTELTLCGAIGAIAHVAYHIGAIRQILTEFKSGV